MINLFRKKAVAKDTTPIISLYGSAGIDFTEYQLGSIHTITDVDVSVRVMVVGLHINIEGDFSTIDYVKL